MGSCDRECPFCCMPATLAPPDGFRADREGPESELRLPHLHNQRYGRRSLHCYDSYLKPRPVRNRNFMQSVPEFGNSRCRYIAEPSAAPALRKGIAIQASFEVECSRTYAPTSLILQQLQLPCRTTCGNKRYFQLLASITASLNLPAKLPRPSKKACRANGTGLSIRFSSSKLAPQSSRAPVSPAPCCVSWNR